MYVAVWSNMKIYVHVPIKVIKHIDAYASGEILSIRQGNFIRYEGFIVNLQRGGCYMNKFC